MNLFRHWDGDGFLLAKRPCSSTVGMDGQRRPSLLTAVTCHRCLARVGSVGWRCVSGLTGQLTPARTILGSAPGLVDTVSTRSWAVPFYAVCDLNRSTALGRVRVSGLLTMTSAHWMRRGLCGVYGEVAISVVEDTLRHRQSDGTVAARAFAAGQFRVRAANVHERHVVRG